MLTLEINNQQLMNSSRKSHSKKLNENILDRRATMKTKKIEKKKQEKPEVASFLDSTFRMIEVRSKG